jgi:superfamily II DNA or RNA helicase
MSFELYPWQVESAEKILASLRENHVAADWSDTGTGKTAKAVWVAKKFGKPFAVICPKGVIPSWKEWCEKAGIDPVFILNYEKLRAGTSGFGDFHNGSWVWSGLTHDTLLIWDEVHKCKGANSLNGKMLIQSRPFNTLMLSATFASNPMDMKATGFLLGLHKYTDFFPWMMKNGVKKAPWGSFAYFGGKAKLGVIHEAILPKSTRIRVSELGDAFPDNEVQCQAFDCGDSDAIWLGLQERLAELESSRASDKPNPMTEILRARQEAEMIRLPVISELANDLVDEGRNVVIFCNFRNSLDLLCQDASKGRMSIYGGQADDERQDAIDSFQKNSCKVLVCQIQAGGVGLSLHDLNGRPRSSLICPTYSAIDLKQALGRIHRAGALSKAIQQIVFSSGSIEEKVMRRVRAKLKDIETLNDGDMELI